MDNSIRVDITPDKSLVQKLGLVGYRTEQAIAELLDNSIDARIFDKQETVEVHLDFQEKRIAVRDNGHGMDKQDLTNAMTIARGTKTNDALGQFGIGMKSACSALGKKFTITTSKINSNKEYSTEYDEKNWLSDKGQNWKNFIITEKTLIDEENWHGTRITISELNVPLYPNQVSKFKENFGIRSIYLRYWLSLATPISPLFSILCMESFMASVDSYNVFAVAFFIILHCTSIGLSSGVYGGM